MKRFLCLTLAVILCMSLAVPALAVDRSGKFIVDDTGHLAYNDKTSLQQTAELYSEMSQMDILYVRTDEQNLEEYAAGLNMGERYHQVMLIENETEQKVLFFGKAQLLTQSDAQELLAAYNDYPVSALGLHYYIEAALILINQRRNEGVFDYVPDEYLEQVPRLVDDARLLGVGPRRNLLKKLDEISARQKMDVLLVTVEDLGTTSPQSYAKEFRQNHVFGPGEYDDGILLLVEDEEFWLFPLGMGSRTFTDDGLDYISMQIKTVLKNDGYAQAFEEYVDLCDDFINQASSGKPYDGVHMPKSPFRWGLYLVISLLAGVIAGCVVLFRHKDELTSVRFHYDAEDYIKTVHVDAMTEEKTYLYSTTERRLKS